MSCTSSNHPYHSFYTTDASGNTLISWTFLQEALGVNNDKYDEAAQFTVTQQWRKLRADIELVLNALIARAADPASGQVYQLIDTEKMGQLGHSLGGAAVVQVAPIAPQITGVEAASGLVESRRAPNPRGTLLLLPSQHDPAAVERHEVASSVRTARVRPQHVLQLRVGLALRPLR